jgi:hypothetical protein
LPRVSEVVQSAQQIVAAPSGRAELVALSSALTHVYLACMAKLMETPMETAFIAKPPPEEDCRLLTMPQVADILHIPVYSARELGRRGTLPTIHIGARVLVSLTTLRSFVRERQNGLHTREARQVDSRLPRRVR